MEKKFTTENFTTEVLNADKPVLVDFYADWCGPCRMMSPIVEQLAVDMEGKAIIGKLNIDDNEEIAMKYGVMNLPTRLLFKNGAEVDRIVGSQNREVLERMLQG